MTSIFKAARNMIWFFVLAISVQAYAQEEVSDLAVIIEKHIEHFVVQSDGTYVQTTEELRHIGQERGIKSSAQQYFPYNATLQSIDILEAYTQKPDGRKIIVKPEQIRVQQEPRSFSAPMFQDVQYKVIIFPEIAVGDRIYVKLQRKEHTPLFPGHFINTTFPMAFPYQDFRLIYDLPTAMKLREDSAGFRKMEPTVTGDRTHYEWTYIPQKRPRAEVGSVAYADYGDRLFVSTFADYPDFAKAYQARATDKSVVTPKIKAFSEKLTAGLSDPKAKTQVLYNWVRKNVRYVAVYVGQDGVVPHTAETILDNLYGDCKDHVTLLEALLSASGIESTPALINLGTAYRLPDVPTIGVINHVITYVPVFDLYLDSTAASIDFGYLPLPDMGKPVVLTKLGRVASTPSQQFGKVATEIHIKINEDGSATFKHSEIQQGAGAEPTRSTIRNLKLSEREKLGQRLLLRLNLKGNGRLDVGNISDTGETYRYGISGKIDSFVNLPGPAGLPAFTSFGTGIWGAIMGLDSEKSRQLPFLCQTSEADEFTEIEFFTKDASLRLPAGIKINTTHFEFESTYTQNKNVVSINRHYKSKFDSAVCDPAMYEDMKDVLKSIRRDLSNQLIVEFSK